MNNGKGMFLNPLLIDGLLTMNQHGKVIMQKTLMCWPMRYLLTLLVLLPCSGVCTVVAADQAPPSRSGAWRMVLCIAETQLGEGEGTECVVVVRNMTDAPLPVTNTVHVKQYELPAPGKPAAELTDGSHAMPPTTATADPRIAKFMELWSQTPSITLTIEGPYTASYVRPMVIWNQGLMQRVEVRPEQPHYRGVNLPGSLFQTGQYRLRAVLTQEGQVLAQSNVQVVHAGRPPDR